MKFKYEYINENAFFKILGYTEEELIGKSALKFMHPDDITHVAKTLFEGYKSGSGGAELRFRHKNGSWIWIEGKGQTFKEKIKGRTKLLEPNNDIYTPVQKVFQGSPLFEMILILLTLLLG